MSLIESIWLSFASNFSPFVLIAVGTFVVNTLIWIVLNIPYILIDQYKVFQQYKIQKNVVNDSKEMWKQYISSIISQVALGPIILLGWPVFKFCNFSAGAFPSWWTLFWQFWVFNLVEDALFYWTHRLMHIPYLFKTVHYIHHKYPAPYSVVGSQAHPIELIFNFMLPTILPPFVWGLWTGEMHVLVFWTWLFYREMRATEAHSGYILPWHLQHVLKYIGYHGSASHDIHHSKTKFNFGSFVIWDYICGTDASDVDFQPNGRFAKKAE